MCKKSFTPLRSKLKVFGVINCETSDENMKELMKSKKKSKKKFQKSMKSFFREIRSPLLLGVAITLSQVPVFPI